MARRTALPLALFLFLGATAPAGAQDVDPLAPDLEAWTALRPDGHPPAGVENALTLDAGRYLLSYRYSYTSLDELRIGTDTISAGRALDEFTFLSAPFAGNVRSHELGVLYGLTDRLTLAARVPYLQKRLEEVSATDFFVVESEGFGDVEAGARFLLVEEGPYRFHVHLDLSAPTGSVKKTWPTPLAAPDRARLPFQMQTGSGTWDLEPGMTLLAQNADASVGGQLAGTIRLDDADPGFTLGNRFLARGWGAYAFTERISASLGLLWEVWDEVEGFDRETDPTTDPAFDPQFQGGDRLEVPFGFNLYFPDGILAGHRLLFEATVPVREDLDGPQLSRDWSIALGWQKTH